MIAAPRRGGRGARARVRRRWRPASSASRASAELSYAPRATPATPRGSRPGCASAARPTCALGRTTHGPHLDEVEDLARRPLAAPLRVAGPAAAALLALLFAEREALLETARRAAADAPRRRDERARRRAPRAARRRGWRGGGQTLITATEAAHLPRARRERFEVQGPRRRRRTDRRWRHEPPARPRSAGVRAPRRARRRARRRPCSPPCSRSWERPRRRDRGRGQPVAERDGVVTVACRSAAWAQELDLMQERAPGAPQRARSASSARGSAVHRRRGPARAAERRFPATSGAPAARHGSPGAAFMRDLQGFSAACAEFPWAAAAILMTTWTCAPTARNGPRGRPFSTLPVGAFHVRITTTERN